MISPDPKTYKSPTFCTLPWIHLASTPNGRAKMCCLAKNNLTNNQGEAYNLTKHSISEIWNSDKMREIRKKMLDGEKISDCLKCYQEEELGVHSMRIGFNEKWLKQEPREIENRVLETVENDYHLKAPPWYYDLRQGNLCNLKCRSCSPENSVSIEKESQILAQKSNWYRTNINNGKPVDESYKNWFNSDFFNQQLINNLPHIKKIYFTGGEPTLIEKNYTLMRHCISTEHSKHIELMFNTNMTNINDDFLHLIKHFKFVTLNLSIEGIGSVQEYLRGNTQWNKIEQSLIKLAENKQKNFSYLVTPVIQSSNILNFVEMLRYFESLNKKYGEYTFQFMPIILTEPEHLDFNILPQEIKSLAKQQLLDYLETSDLVKTDRYLPIRINQIISRLSEPAPKNVHALTHRFIRYSQILDKQRHQSFPQTFPLLFELWQKHSPSFNWQLLDLELEKNNSFCSIPFTHLNTTTGGLYRYCCIIPKAAQNEQKQILTLNGNSLSEVWNSTEIKQLRMQMLKGERNPLCQKCHYDEDHGSVSLRKDYTKTWISDFSATLEKNVLQALQNEGHISSQPSFIELKFNNLCNIKCRMCSPNDSSLVGKEYNALATDNEWFDKLWAHRNNILYNEKMSLADKPNWVSNKAKWQQFIDLIPELEKVHFAGGEPTLHNELYDFLEICQEKDRAKNIELSMNTNLTNLPERLLKALPNFKSVHIHVSVEGFGSTQEYIRYPSVWPKLENHLRILTTLPSNTYIYICPTLQIYNVENVLELFRFVDALIKSTGKHISITPGLLDNPNYLDLRLLPLNYRKLVADKWHQYKTTVHPTYDWWHKKIDALVSIIETAPQPTNSSQELKTFLQFTQVLDKARQQDFQTTFPQLYSAITQYLNEAEYSRNE